MQKQPYGSPGRLEARGIPLDKTAREGAHLGRKAEVRDRWLDWRPIAVGLTAPPHSGQSGEPSVEFAARRPAIRRVILIASLFSCPAASPRPPATEGAITQPQREPILRASPAYSVRLNRHPAIRRCRNTSPFGSSSAFGFSLKQTQNNVRVTYRSTSGCRC